MVADSSNGRDEDSVFTVRRGGGRPRTAQEYARSEIRAAILSARFEAGRRLPQVELAAQLGISATPVREALRDLATEGLVALDPHHGAFVRGLKLSEVAEIYELRIQLEPIMVRRVIDKISEDQLRRATELYHKLDRTTDMAEWSSINRRFHSIFTEADEGSRLCVILNGLRDSASPYVALSLRWQPKHTRESNVEHGRLLELYRKRAVDEVIELTVQHLQGTMNIIATGYDSPESHMH